MPCNKAIRYKTITVSVIVVGVKKIMYSRFGGPEVLELVESERPHPGEGQIRISVRAAAVNAFDWRVREGQRLGAHPVTLPSGLGIDASGVVDMVGPGVMGTAVGDAVFGEGRDTYAESAVMTVWHPMPAPLSYEEAAGYPSVLEAALRVLDEVEARSGETLLVSGAAGGVGSAVVQIARSRGVHVIGTAGTGNQRYLRSIGASATTYGDGWVDRVRALGTIDAALDLAGAGVLPQLVQLTGNPNRVVTIADLDAAQHGVHFSGAAGDVAGALAEGSRLVVDGVLKLPVAATYTLAEAAAAHVDSRAGHTRGRRIIVI